MDGFSHRFACGGHNNTVGTYRSIIKYLNWYTRKIGKPENTTKIARGQNVGENRYGRTTGTRIFHWGKPNDWEEKKGVCGDLSRSRITVSTTAKKPHRTHTILPLLGIWKVAKYAIIFIVLNKKCKKPSRPYYPTIRNSIRNTQIQEKLKHLKSRNKLWID